MESIYPSGFHPYQQSQHHIRKGQDKNHFLLHFWLFLLQKKFINSIYVLCYISFQIIIKHFKIDKKFNRIQAQYLEKHDLRNGMGKVRAFTKGTCEHIKMQVSLGKMDELLVWKFSC